MIHRENPPGIAPPVGQYSHLAVVPTGCELLVFAGQIGLDPEGTLPAETDAQFRNALANVAALLEHAGSGVDRIIKANLWFTDPLERSVFQSIWGSFVGSTPPPTTLAYVNRLARPEYSVEVEVWAVRAPAQDSAV